MAAATEERVSARTQLRNWFVEINETEEEYDITEVATRAVQQFGSDPDWVRQMWLPLIKQELRMLVAQMRDRTLLGEVVVNQEGLEERARRLGAKWGKWREHTEQGYTRLFDMTRGQLLEAADRRERIGLTEMRTAVLWRKLAARMTDAQQVSECWDDDEIEALAVEIEQTVTASSVSVNGTHKPSHTRKSK